jgi:hypothetical protein
MGDIVDNPMLESTITPSQGLRIGLRIIFSGFGRYNLYLIELSLNAKKYVKTFFKAVQYSLKKAKVAGICFLPQKGIIRSETISRHIEKLQTKPKKVICHGWSDQCYCRRYIF